VPVLAPLNPEQQEAVRHPPADGPLLVIAGAGTGKTLTLASRLAWLVQQGADPQRVLLMTFSRRAAAEMARRAARLLHQSLGLPSNTAPPTLPWCGTFHSVAARLLREEAPRIGLAPGFTVLDRSDAQDLMAHTRQALGLAEREHRVPLAPTCLAIHSRCLNTHQTLPEVIRSTFPWCLGHETDLARLFAAFGEAKLQQQSLDFDDLLLAWWHLMQAPAMAERIRDRFDHVLVDEVQDINRLQADLLHALKPEGVGLTAVGDDAQSIYAFRGADVQHILAFPRRFDPPAPRKA
jgi:DNA helicase II / ATP-dependent DNA helicase PcrA